MDGIEDKHVFICASFEICTSAVGMETGSDSLRVMLSGDAVMSAEKKEKEKRMTLMKWLYHILTATKPLKPAGDDTARQATITVLSNAE